MLPRSARKWWDYIKNGPKIIDEKMLWDFRRKETVDQWYVLDDNMEVGGKSRAKLDPNGKGTCMWEELLGATPTYIVLCIYPYYGVN